MVCEIKFVIGTKFSDSVVYQSGGKHIEILTKNKPINFSENFRLTFFVNETDIYNSLKNCLEFLNGISVINPIFFDLKELEESETLTEWNNTKSLLSLFKSHRSVQFIAK